MKSFIAKRLKLRGHSDPEMSLHLRDVSRFPGDILRGLVLVHVPSPVDLVTIEVKVLGEEIAHVGNFFGTTNPERRRTTYYEQRCIVIGQDTKRKNTDSSSDDDNDGDDDNSKNGNNNSSEGNSLEDSISSLPSVLLSDNKHLVKLQSGTYSFPFRILLPDSLPPSLTVAHGKESACKMKYMVFVKLRCVNPGCVRREKTPLVILPLPVPVQRWVKLHAPINPSFRHDDTDASTDDGELLSRTISADGANDLNHDDVRRKLINHDAAPSNVEEEEDESQAGDDHHHDVEPNPTRDRAHSGSIAREDPPLLEVNHNDDPNDEITPNEKRKDDHDNKDISVVSSGNNKSVDSDHVVAFHRASSANSSNKDENEANELALPAPLVEEENVFGLSSPLAPTAADPEAPMEVGTKRDGALSTSSYRMESEQLLHFVPDIRTAGANENNNKNNSVRDSNNGARCRRPSREDVEAVMPAVWAHSYLIALRSGILSKSGRVRVHVIPRTIILVRGRDRLDVRVGIDNTAGRSTISKLKYTLITRQSIRSKVETDSFSTVLGEVTVPESVPKGTTKEAEHIELPIPINTPITNLTAGCQTRTFLNVRLYTSTTVATFSCSVECELLIVNGVDIMNKSRRLRSWKASYIRSALAKGVQSGLLISLHESNCNPAMLDAAAELASSTSPTQYNNNNHRARVGQSAVQQQRALDYTQATFTPAISVPTVTRHVDPLASLNPFARVAASE